ncbi:uncharacterized protein M6B38_389900 [Iris pallida]|uniref:Uncharacterized protein n=1 Tax=Iris pallida TaxID=29817 RepID=A0AAX6G1J3_IRIPA|nr:uncharacterized protein M6B38_389900 [Iris pallida]
MILPSSSSSSSIISTSPCSSNGNQHHLPLPKTLFLSSTTHLKPPPSAANTKSCTNNKGGVRISTAASASLLQRYPVLFDAGRVCIFYALLKAGLAGSPSNPFISSSSSAAADFPVGGDDLGFSQWFESFQGRSEDKKASDRRKLVSKWHPTMKGTLKRSYRVPSKTEGRRLLKAIASLLSDDDHFVDASSHKGCQIRRESAHGESVCCNNVRALFDELPTPHLVVEITAFPAGPLADKDYVKAEKLERVLRSGSSI